jgi:prepilin-type N-terminal cleavage/methylation domain-containing protein
MKTFLNPFKSLLQRLDVGGQAETCSNLRRIDNLKVTCERYNETPSRGDRLADRKKLRLQFTRAFSLVELMIVVAIIGILAALAIPRFQQFQSKSRQAEARSNLAHIYTLQVSYGGDNDSFSDFECLTLGTTTPSAGGTAKNCGGIGAGAWADVNSCNTTNDIGFRVTDCKKVRYVYSSKGDQNRFTATASEMDAGGSTTRRVFPGCTGNTDEWQIDQSKSLYNLEYTGGTALQSCNN